MTIGDIQAELVRIERLSTTGWAVKTSTHLHIHPVSLAQVLESCNLHQVLDPDMIHSLLGFIIVPDQGIAPGRIALSRGPQDVYYHHTPPAMAPLQAVLNSVSAATFNGQRPKPELPPPFRLIELD